MISPFDHPYTVPPTLPFCFPHSEQTANGASRWAQAPQMSGFPSAALRLTGLILPQIPHSRARAFSKHAWHSLSGS